MRSDKDGSSVDVPPTPTAEPEPQPANAFDGKFLSRLEDREEPPTAAEAEFAGPWRIGCLPPSYGGGFGIFREGERPDRGYGPVARFSDLWLAQLTAALLPALTRDAAYRLREERETEGDFEGWALESREAWGAVVGHLRYFDPAVVSGLQVLEGLMRSPWALALLLTACGKTALEKAGAILDSWIPPSR
jgi:hypothetical protein